MCRLRNKTGVCCGLYGKNNSVGVSWGRRERHGCRTRVVLHSWMRNGCAADYVYGGGRGVVGLCMCVYERGEGKRGRELESACVNTRESAAAKRGKLRGCCVRSEKPVSCGVSHGDRAASASACGAHGHPASVLAGGGGGGSGSDRWAGGGTNEASL